jgi:hypothetical protein
LESNIFSSLYFRVKSHVFFCGPALSLSVIGKKKIAGLSGWSVTVEAGWPLSLDGEGNTTE